MKISVAEEIELRRTIASHFWKVVERFIMEPLTKSNIDMLHFEINEAMVGLTRTGIFNAPETIPRFNFRVDPANRSEIQIIPSNDSATWLLAMGRD